MGWDGIILCDESVDIVDMSVRYVEAVQKESCGRCVPCRIGSKVILDILKGIADGRGKKEDLARIPTIAAEWTAPSADGTVSFSSGPFVLGPEFERSITEGQGEGGRLQGVRHGPCDVAPPSSISRGTWRR